jgi:hypothetical protein
MTNKNKKTFMQKEITHMRRDGQIKGNTSGFQAYEKNFALWVISKFLNSNIPSTHCHASIQLNARYT